MIVVTGASGLVGSFLTEALRQQGHQVKALSRRDFSGRNTSGLTWLQGDLLDPVFLSDVLADATHVFHCAGLVSYAPQDKELLQKINVEGTANLVNACLEKGNIRFCHVSSIAAVEKEKNKPETDENAKWDLNAAHTAYADSKYQGEVEVWRGMAEGLSAVIVNPTIILGPGNWDESSTRLFRYVYDEKPFYTEGKANFVDVRDVVDLMLTLTFSEIRGERFILNAAGLEFQDFFKQIASCFGKKAPDLKISSILVELLWRLEHVRSLITGKRPLITKDTARTTRRNQTYSAGKIKKTLHFGFRPIEETIAWCCSELLRRNALPVN
jgi:dihydroflavonol-4-reductase